MEKKASEPTWEEKIEQAIREAVGRVPGLRDIAEKDYCMAVIEAVDTFKFGVAMRLSELGDDDEDDE